jgi:hypothetical protein
MLVVLADVIAVLIEIQRAWKVEAVQEQLEPLRVLSSLINDYF